MEVRTQGAVTVRWDVVELKAVSVFAVGFIGVAQEKFRGWR
jgi:hypothetical protein